MSAVETLAEYAEITENEFKRYLPEKNCLQKTVVEAARYSLSAGGKRIRPALVMEFCRICGEEPLKALPAAAAIEFMHTFSLIHDDLPCMDDDDLRRGKPSCHKQFGEAAALLAGDGLAIKPFEIIAQAGLKKTLSQGAALRLIKLLGELAGFSGMVGGQMIDLEAENKKTSPEVILEMYRMKTGALIEFCCRAGVICAEGGPKEEMLAGTFGQRLGLAFQIVDDILDVTAEQTVLGKPVGSDEKKGKYTYVSAVGLEKAKEQANALTKQALEALDEMADKSETEFLRELSELLVNRSY